MGTSNDMNDRITRAEALRIRNIQRQLATIDENHRDDNERVQIVNEENFFDLNIGSSVPNISSFGGQLCVRRQSSVDPQILEEWRAPVDGLKLRENWPWTIQKLLIRRHLRRQQYIKNYQSLRKQSIP